MASAQLLLDAGDVEGACNRAYYAMFDAAHAALLWVGANDNPAATKTHRGLVAAFANQLIKPGRLPVELGKSLNQVESMRLLADYTGEDIDAEKAQWALGQAKAFVLAIRRLVIAK